MEFHLHRLRRCGMVAAHRLDALTYWFREPVTRHERESAEKRLLGHPLTVPGRAFGFLMETNGLCTTTIARALGLSPGHKSRPRALPSTGERSGSDHVYVMDFKDAKIPHVTKIWNGAFVMKQLEWVQTCRWERTSKPGLR